MAQFERQSSLSGDGNTAAIVCKDVPTQYNNKPFLKTHFSQYGKVVKIYNSPEKLQASVYFDNKESAVNAIKSGKILAPDCTPMKVFWKRPMTRKSVDGQGIHSHSLSESTEDASADLDSHTHSAGYPSSLASPSLRLAKSTLLFFGKKPSTLRPAQKTPAAGRAKPFHAVTGTAAATALFGKKVALRGRPATSSPALSGQGASEALDEYSPVGSPLSLDHTPPREVLSCTEDRTVPGILRGSIASTVEEQYKILDAWDKQVKQGLRRQSDISTARATVGTCADMCPEKERYMREFQRRVHAYETMTGTEANPRMDHALAVKEYSRSSADQEEPLPSELRPAHVLASTMDYLVTRIVDSGGAEGGNSASWGDWYDFLWDRTRGIRKDITQQHLCDDTAVDLVEKCARFHVFCAERLCEETAQAFDRKINDENLTKCLQTLRELYNDLRRGRATACINEAEFRGYMVLMKLNEGDTLRDVQHLEADLRNSAEIQFVLAVYSSLESCNYTRFFKLVKTGTFLNACLMHRYFGQIRMKALNIMLKAYHRAPKFPMDDFIRVLHFENEDEAIEFCRHHGLSASTEDGVHLSRTSDFMQPDVPLRVRRAVQLIESKTTSSIGQVIYGGPLPDVAISLPHSSFDGDGKFIRPIGQDLYADPSPSVTEPDGSSLPRPFMRATALPADASPGLAAASAQPAPAPPATYSAVLSAAQPTFAPIFRHQQAPVPASVVEAMKDAAREMCLTVTDELAKGVAVEVLSQGIKCLEAVRSVASGVIDEVVRSSLRFLAEGVLAEFQAERAALEKAERSRVLTVISSTCVDDLVAMVVDTEARAIAYHVHSSVSKRQQHEIDLDVGAAAAMAALVEDEAGLLAEGVAHEVYRSDVVERLAALEDSARRFALWRKCKLLARWRVALSARRRMKEFMLNFPPGPRLSAELAVVKAVRSSLGKAESWQSAKRWEVYSDGGLATRRGLRLDVNVVTKRLKLARLQAPLNVAQIVAPSLAKKMELDFPAGEGSFQNAHRPLGDLISFKLMLVLPADQYDPLSELIIEKLAYGDAPTQQAMGEVPILSMHCTQRGRWQVSACIRELGWALTAHTAAAVAAAGYCRGSTAVLYVLPPATRLEPEDSWSRRSHQRLHLALSTKPVMPPLPLLLFVSTGHERKASFTPATPAEVADTLNLDAFISHGLISCHRIILVDGMEDVTDELTEGLQWLADNSPSEPRVGCNDVISFVDSFLVREFYWPVYEDLSLRSKHSIVHQEPNCLVTLYNRVIEHLAALASSRSLLHISWPPVEYCRECRAWNADSSYLDDVGEFLLCLRLPAFEHRNGRELHLLTDPWREACKDVEAYVACLVQKDKGNGPTSGVSLISSIRACVAKAASRFRSLDDRSRLSKSSAMIAAEDTMPWMDVVSACVEYRLSAVLDTELAQGMKIWYLEEELQLGFSSPDCWLQARAISGGSRTAAVTSLIEVGQQRIQNAAHAIVAPLFPTSPLVTASDAATSNSHHSTAKRGGCDSLMASVTSVRQQIADEKVQNEGFERRLVCHLQAVDMQSEIVDDGQAIGEEPAAVSRHNSMNLSYANFI